MHRIRLCLSLLLASMPPSATSARNFRSQLNFSLPTLPNGQPMDNAVSTAAAWNDQNIVDQQYKLHIYAPLRPWPVLKSLSLSFDGASTIALLLSSEGHFFLCSCAA